MKTFDVINKDQEILGKFFLEASAGTGKTFAIEHVIARLLLEKESISINQMLIVTFTNKAAAELKNRIRKNIESILKIFKQDEINENISDYLKPFIKNDKRFVISRLEDALIFFDQAQIFTIHSFCYRMLKEFAFEANVNLIEEDEDNFEYIKKIIIDFLKYSLDPNIITIEQLDILLSKYQMDQLISKIISYAKDIKIEDTFSTFLENFKSQISKISKKILLENILNDFDLIQSSYKKKNNQSLEEYQEQIELLFNIIQKDNVNDRDLKNLIRTRLTICDFLNDNNKKLRAKDIKIQNILFFEDLKNKLYPLIAKMIDPFYLFELVAKQVFDHVDLILENEEIFTFDKILQKMNHSLANIKFKSSVQKKYEVVIVDEFQDTDPIQYDIFEKLFLSEEKKLKALYFIGDPKQSIYRFRKADIYTYLRALNKVGNVNYLTTNYRSSPNLIDALNALFAKDFSNNWLTLPKIDKYLPYIPINSGLKKILEITDDKSSLHFFMAEDKIRKKCPPENVENLYFNFIANEILTFITKGFSLESFVVLVKDRYQAKRLEKYFHKINIKSKLSNPSTLKESKALKAFQEFFEAVLDPKDLSKVKKALMGPFIDFSNQEVLNLSNESQEVLEIFYQLRNAFAKKGIAEFFSLFFQSKFHNISILEKIASANDISIYFDIMQITELILENENLTIDKILSFFEKLSLLDAENEILKRRSFFEEGVEIMTTHMSKGLEFDIVFALGLASRSEFNDNENTEEIDAEKLRQLYVALTRAKYRVYVPIFFDKNNKKVIKGKASAIELFLSNILNNNMYDCITKEAVLEKFQNYKNRKLVSFSNTILTQLDTVKEKSIALHEPKRVFYKNDNSSILSFSSLPNEHKNHVDLDIDKEKLSFPLGAEIGVIFHSIFEKIFKQNSFAEDDIKLIVKEELIFSTFEEYESIIFDNVKLALYYPLIEGVSLTEIKPEDVFVETEFLCPFDKKNYLKGFIDLVFIYKNKYYLLDWKTNYLGINSENYSKINIEKSMNEHNYFMQAAIYAQTLIRYIKNIEKRDEKLSFGGAFYVFLRGLEFGKGVYFFKPEISLLNQIKTKN